MENKKKVAVFGATGRVGKYVVDYLARKGGCIVQAISRNPGKIGINHAFIKPYKADILQLDQVKEAIEGCDTVIISVEIEPYDNNTGKLVQTAHNVVEACKDQKIKRIIVMSGYGVLQDEEGKYLNERSDYPQQFVVTSKVQVKAYQVIKESGIDYTYICLPWVKELPFTGKYIVGVEKLPEINKFFIGDRDLADFVVNEYINKLYLNKRVSISSNEDAQV